MTDKRHDTRQDTQKAAGELQGRARWGQRERGQTARQPERTQKAERNEPGNGETEGDTRKTGIRERTGRQKKKEIYKYLRERREKKHR